MSIRRIEAEVQGADIMLMKILLFRESDFESFESGFPSFSILVRQMVYTREIDINIKQK